MSGFKHLVGDTALVRERGVFKQVPLVEYRGQLFAQTKGGYVRLNHDGSTSAPGVNFIELLYEGPLLKDSFGRLCTTPGENRTALLERSGPLAIGSE